MVNWRLVFTKQAQKDATKISRAGLKPCAECVYPAEARKGLCDFTGKSE